MLRAEVASLKPGPLDKVSNVALYETPIISDARGRISVCEVGRTLPFEVKRYFVVFDVPSEEVRGTHAHRTCHQFLVCLRGQISIAVDDGRNREEIDLISPAWGVHVPPMVWAAQYRYSSDAMLLVLASESYDAADYIRSYDEFKQALRDS